MKKRSGKDYDDYYKLAERNKRGFKVTRAYRYGAGRHPSIHLGYRILSLNLPPITSIKSNLWIYWISDHTEI